MRKQVARFFFAVLGVWLPLLSVAAGSQDMQSLQQAAQTWVAEQLNEPNAQVQIVAVPADILLPACQVPLQIAPQGNAELRGRVNLRVTCSQPDWFVFVTAEVLLHHAVVVAATALPRGTALSASQLRLMEIDVSRVRGNYYTDPQDLQGMRLRSAVRADEVITTRHLIAVNAVERGDQVVIRAVGENLSIRMMGEAMESGRVGDQVRVRNVQSGRVIRARVTDRGQVEVNF